MLESGLLREVGEATSLSVPVTARHPVDAAGFALGSPRSAGRGKEVAQIGAVIGREFSFDLVAAAAEMDESKLENALDELVRSELAFCHSPPPNSV